MALRFSKLVTGSIVSQIGRISAGPVGSVVVGADWAYLVPFAVVSALPEDDTLDFDIPLPPVVPPPVTQIFAINAPPAANTTAINATGIAANNPSNMMPGVFNSPANPRNVSVTYPAGWDGGAITVSGVDAFSRLQTETIPATPGSTVNGVKAFLGVSGATKTLVGVTLGIATLGVGNTFGVKAQLTQTGALLVDNVAEPVILDTTNNTFTPTLTLPNGTANYLLMASVPAA